MSLQTSYRFIAPFYDFFLQRASAALRQRSLQRLPPAGRTRAQTGRAHPAVRQISAPRERAWLRRSLSPVVAQLATRLDVVFEDVLAMTPGLRVLSNEAALVNGWFRLIELTKEE